jgi:SpoVK/Ycf46/Vps4 family AAA+-type ATPase
VEGAAAGDYQKVVAYVRQLSDRLEADGEAEAAKRLREILDKGKVTKFGFAKAGNGQPPDSPRAVPVDSESRLPTADEDHFGKGEVEMFLPTDAQRVVNQFLACYRAAGRLLANGVGVSASMLIYGPPGCGKTQLARFIASELGLPMITARTDSLISSYLGSTAKNIRYLFEHAVSRPCVLFLDEFDALAKMRDDGRELGELKRVVISLLQNIDAMGHDHALIAATNHEHLLDPAIWRRFTYKVHLLEPDLDTRKAMLRQFFSRFANEELVNIVAALGDGLSGAHLRHIAEDCIRSAVLADAAHVSVQEAVRLALESSPKTADSAYSSLAEQLKTLRNLNPKVFTQSRLAQIFGVSQPQVSKLLKGGS